MDSWLYFECCSSGVGLKTGMDLYMLLLKAINLGFFLSMESILSILSMCGGSALYPERSVVIRIFSPFFIFGRVSYFS
jgi:hypothetical protein